MQKSWYKRYKWIQEKKDKHDANEAKLGSIIQEIGKAQKDRLEEINTEIDQNRIKLISHHTKILSEVQETQTTRDKLQSDVEACIQKYQDYTKKLGLAEKEVLTKEGKIEAYRESFEKYTETVKSINKIYANKTDAVENRKEIEGNSDM